MKGSIIGGGIAGLTSAILLEQAGIKTEITELAAEWKPVGAGIVLWPNCLKILERIGLKDKVESLGNPIEEMRVIDTNGKKINSLNFENVFSRGFFASAIARADLHSVLVSGLKDTKVLLSDTAESISQNESKVNVKFRSGRTDEFDFVIGADGINSKVRSILFGDIKTRYSGYTTWRFMVKGDIDFDRRHAYEIWGRGKRFGIVPVGRENIYYCFAVMNSSPGLEANRNITVDKFLKVFEEFKPAAGKVISLINNDTRLINNDLCDIRLSEWHKGRAVLAGDAAHAITPNMGAGAAMAMEDSAMIADELVAGREPKIAFRNFFAGRNKRVTKVCNDSYRLGKMAQLENKLLRSLRNSLFRLVPESYNINVIKKLTGEK